MTIAQTIRVTCDRCGVEESHDKPAEGDMPSGWVPILFGPVRGELCLPCAAAIKVALRYPYGPPTPPPPPVARLCLTIEDHRIAVDDAEATICTAIEEAVAEFRATPTRMLDPDAFAQVLNGKRHHAEALVHRIHARVKERPHG